MITVYKANRIVRVTENELNKYLAKGYVVQEEPVPQPITVDMPEVVEVQPTADEPTENGLVVQSEVQPKRTRKRK